MKEISFNDAKAYVDNFNVSNLDINSLGNIIEEFVGNDDDGGEFVDDGDGGDFITFFEPTISEYLFCDIKNDVTDNILHKAFIREESSEQWYELYDNLHKKLMTYICETLNVNEDDYFFTEYGKFLITRDDVKVN